MAPIIGSDALDVHQTPANNVGVAECGFSLTVGVQAKNVLEITRSGYDHQVTAEQLTQLADARARSRLSRRGYRDHPSGA